MTKLDRQMSIVLETWLGTPEELGETLETATREHLGPEYTKEFRRQWLLLHNADSAELMVELS